MKECDKDLVKIAKLENEVKFLRSMVKASGDIRIKRLLDVIEFYAKEWRSDVYTGPTSLMIADNGRRARECLAAILGENDGSTVVKPGP